MKILIPILFVPFVSLLSNCSRTMAIPTDEGDAASTVESGAQFKEGHGLSLSAVMARSIDLKTAEVMEEVIAPSFTASFQAIQSGSTEATGWVPEKQASEPLSEGTPIRTTFNIPAGDPVSAIPRSALLTTVEGTYAFVKNDAFFVRTPIKIGAANSQHIAVTDGLYTGDEIVTSGVMQLWLAELQFLRGGKACTCD